MRSAALLSFSILLLGGLTGSACASGKRWVDEPETSLSSRKGARLLDGATPQSRSKPGAPHFQPQTIGGTTGPLTESELADAPGTRPQLALEDRPVPTNAPPDARFLGVFRNTYYDFPAEVDFKGASVSLMNSSCQAIRQVPRGFYEAVCVQGSGSLVTGSTVSFAKRNCACAETCPRTGQKICFDELDRSEFPWGRGAMGKPIVPLRSIAVDSNVIPLGTPVYIAEYDGVPRTPGGALHDGCFVAEDRGLAVQGEHVDIFSGDPRTTQHLNSQVPSNRGVHVYVGTARCHSASL